MYIVLYFDNDFFKFLNRYLKFFLVPLKFKMDKNQTLKSNNGQSQKKQNTREDNAKGTNAAPSNRTTPSCSSNGVNSVKSMSRSRSTLLGNKNYTPSRLRSNLYTYRLYYLLIRLFIFKYINRLSPPVAAHASWDTNTGPL